MVQPEQVRKFLSNPLVRWSLAHLARRNGNGRALLDEVLAAYAGQDRRKLKYIPHFILVEVLRYLLKMDRVKLANEIFSNRASRRALSNVARSVAEFGPDTPQVFSAPLLVVWNFTNACNLLCQHCYQNARQALPDELSLEERLKVIDELDYNDVPMLAFSGGEPLLQKDFWTVAEYAHKKGFHLSVATNGTLITKEVAARLKEVGIRYVEISLDSAKPEVHDAFRGVSGYWVRTIEGIKNCVEVEGLLVGLAPTVTRKNFAEMEDLIELAKDLEVNTFYAFNFIPTGRGKGIVDEDLTPPMREEMLQILYRTLLEKEIGVFSTSPQFGRFCYQKAPDDMIITSHYTYSQGQNAKIIADYIGGCGAGRVYCAFQPNGKVTPCVFMPIEVGDLRHQRLEDIWHNSEVLKQLRNREAIKEHCRICKHRSMCGGCRARAYGYFQDYLGPDPGCINNLKAWKEIVAQEETAQKQVGIS